MLKKLAFKVHWRDRTIEDAFLTFLLETGWQHP